MNGLEQARALYAPPATREELLDKLIHINAMMGFLATMPTEARVEPTYSRIIETVSSERDAVRLALTVRKK